MDIYQKMLINNLYFLKILFSIYLYFIKQRYCCFFFQLSIQKVEFSFMIDNNIIHYIFGMF